MPASSPVRKRKDDRNDERGSRRRRKKGIGALGLFLLFGAAPAGLAIWYIALPPWRQEEILAKVPQGTGGRALKAGICVALLFALARLALPAFHGAAATLKDSLSKMRARTGVVRILLYPAEFVLWLAWFLVQMLFAVDAVLSLAAAIASLILVARILKPDLLADVVPSLLR